MIFESVITISMLAAGSQLNLESEGIYEIPSSAHEIVVTTPPSEVAWREISLKLAHVIIPFGMDKKVAISHSNDEEISQAFSAATLSNQDGFELLTKAKRFLRDANYPCVKVVPVVCVDGDEDVSYLSLRLHVNANFEKSLELDSQLTRELVKSTVRIPERLSFAVYEQDGNVA